jgi:hypothetical protein
VATGQHAAIRVPVTAVVSDEAAWIDAWSAITANQTDPPERPAVSLEDHTLVVVTLGERPTGGYDVGISRVDYSPGTAVVHVKVTTPPADGMVTQVVTTPYVIAALDGAGLAVSFDGDDVDTGFEL